MSIQVAVDTSSVALSSTETPQKYYGSDPSQPAPTPARIESVVCADERITVRYTTTCSASVTGDVDWVGWQWDYWIDGADRLWDRIEDTGTSLADILAIQVEFTEVGQNDLHFQVCTGGGPWGSDAMCEEDKVVVEVVHGLGGAKGFGVPCENNPSPVFDRWIVDFDLTAGVRGAGTPTDQGTSQHSYVDLPPASEWPADGVPVYAPVDSYLVYAGGVLVLGVQEYGLFLMVSCEVTYHFNHVTNVDDRIAELLEREADGVWRAGPALGGLQVDPVFFAAGDVLFRALPIRVFAKGGFDFGLMDYTHENQFANMDYWSQVDKYVNSLCPFEYYAEPLRSQLDTLLEGGVCHGVSREVVGTLKGMWSYTQIVDVPGPRNAGGGLVFVDYYFEGTDDVVYIGGLYSADVNERDDLGDHPPNTMWTLRLSPDDPTYRLPQDVTGAHCYEGTNFRYPRDTADAWGNIYVYAEVVDDMTINVSFGEGQCPAELPDDYVTFYR